MKFTIKTKQLCNFIRVANVLIPTQSGNLGENLYLSVVGNDLKVVLKNRYKFISNIFPLENIEKEGIYTSFIIDTLSILEILKRVSSNESIISFEVEKNFLIIKDDDSVYKIALNITPIHDNYYNKIEEVDVNKYNLTSDTLLTIMDQMSINEDNICYLKYSNGQYSVLNQNQVYIYSVSDNLKTSDFVSFELAIQVKTLQELVKVAKLIEGGNKITLEIGNNAISLIGGDLRYSILHLHKKYVNFSDQLKNIVEKADIITQIKLNEFLKSVNSVMIFKKDKINQVDIKFQQNAGMVITNHTHNSKAEKILNIPINADCAIKLRYEDILTLCKAFKNDSELDIHVSKNLDYIAVINVRENYKAVFVCSCLL